MKKVLLILLAFMLVVGGVLFADDPPIADATLTLKAKPIVAVLKHGFVASPAEDDSFAGISEMFEDLLEENDVFNNSYDEFNLESDADDFSVGYYYFVANTPSTGYEVFFKVNPFEKDGTAIKVPLTLTLSKLGDGVANNANITYGNISTLGTIDTTVSESAETSVLTTSESSASTPSAYAGIALTASTTGSANLAFGLPADTIDAISGLPNVFTATVIASVVVY